ncbi:MAG: choice-of-anchor Q domain-containing protein [Verrucomicrobiota bacterium]
MTISQTHLILSSFLLATLSAQVYVDPTATGLNNGSSWSDAYNNLTEAIAFSGNNAEIHIAEGIYYPDEFQGGINNNENEHFQIFDKQTLIGGFPSGGSTLSQRRPDLYQTILSGDLEQNDVPGSLVGTNAFAVVKNRSGAGTITLEGLIIQGGVTGIDFDGDADDVLIRGCVIRGNGPADSDTDPSGSNYGGYSFAGSNTDLVNCVISGNVGRIAGGGTLAANGFFLNCTFNGNRGGSFSCDATPSEITQGCLIWNQRPGFPSGLNGSNTNLTFGDTDGSGNLLDPRFWQEVDWERAPTTEGLLRPGLESDAINNAPLDPLHDGRDAGNGGRVFGTSPDIGAYEWRGVRYVDASATGFETGVTWANAYTNLQDALGVGSPGRTIVVAQGSYYPDRGSAVTLGDQSATFTLDQVQLLGGFPPGGGLLKTRDLSGSSILTGDLTGDDGGQEPKSNNTYKVVTLPEKSFSAIDGFTIERGNTADLTDKPHGAGIFSIGEHQLVLKNGSLRRNHADGSGAVGGGLSMVNGSLTAEKMNVSLNQANTNGGAIYLENSEAYFDRIDFVDNTALLNGAGIFADECQTVLADCSLNDNVSQRSGGGFYGLDGMLIAEDLNVWGNTADRNAGGLALVGTDLDGLFLDVRGNSAVMDGGGLWMRSQTVRIETTLVSGNTCGDDGAGIYDLETSPDLINLTLHGNNAGDDGGGLYSRDSSPQLKNCLVAGNEASNSTTSAAASATILGTSFPDYQSCYLENIDLSGTGTNNYDGNDSFLTPSFRSPVDPSTAPTTSGDARQRHPSVAINGGDISELRDPRDLDGRDRALDSLLQSLLPNYLQRIDLGAYEIGLKLASDGSRTNYDLLIGQGSLEFPAGTSYDLPSHASLITPDYLDGSASGWPKPSTPLAELDNTDYTITNADSSSPALRLFGDNFVAGVRVIGATASSPVTDLASFQGAVQSSGTEPVTLLGCTIAGGLRLENLAATISHTSFEDSLEPAYFLNNPSLTAINCSVEQGQFSLSGVADARLEGCAFYDPREGSEQFLTSQEQTYLVNDDSLTEVVNSSLLYNSSLNPVPRVENRNGGTLAFINTLIWQTSPHFAGEGTLLSSDGSSTETFQHSLFWGLDLSTQGIGNLDGSDATLDLSFIFFDSPQLRGDSPLVNAGLAGQAQSTTDLVSRPRVSGDAIDIGAFETQLVHIDPTATGANDGTSWADAYTGTSMLSLSFEERSESTLLFAEGRYRGFAGNYEAEFLKVYPNALSLKDATILGGFPAGGSSIPLRAPQSELTIFTGELTPADDDDFSYNDNIELLVGTTGMSHIEGIIFTGAREHGLRVADSATVENCHFIKNRSTTSTSPLEPVVRQIEGGAAIFVTAYGSGSNSLTLRSCTFFENEDVQTDPSKFPLGGASCVAQNSFSGDVTETLAFTLDAEDCLFVNNKAYRSTTSLGGRGGAVGFRSLTSSGIHFFRAIFRRCQFKGNQAGDLGGAVCGSNGFQLGFENCSFSGNYSNNEAGAIYSPSRFSRQLNFGGPPDFLFFGNATVSVVNSSFQGNQARFRISVMSGLFRIINTVVWENRVIDPISDPFRPVQDGAIDGNDGTNQSTYFHSLIEGVDLLTEPSNGNLDGTDSSNNPRFYAPVIYAERGVAAGLLQPTSNALLNRGATNYTSSAFSPLDASDSDISGDPRIQGAAIDIGAYEGTRAAFPGGAEQALWESDTDGDGASYGEEIAWGTNPNAFDSQDARFFRAEPEFSFQGTLQSGDVSFGVNPNNVPTGTLWVASQSQDLGQTGWRPFFIWDGSDFLLDEGNASIGSNNIATMSPRLLLTSDNGGVQQAPKVFYRFEALRLPPESFPTDCLHP